MDDQVSYVSILFCVCARAHTHILYVSALTAFPLKALGLFAPYFLVRTTNGLHCDIYTLESFPVTFPFPDSGTEF